MRFRNNLVSLLSSVSPLPNSYRYLSLYRSLFLSQSPSLPLSVLPLRRRCLANERAPLGGGFPGKGQALCLSKSWLIRCSRSAFSEVNPVAALVRKSSKSGSNSTSSYSYFLKSDYMYSASCLLMWSEGVTHAPFLAVLMSISAATPYS